MNERTVDLPQLRDDLVINDTFGHHDCKELLERGELGERRVARKSAGDDPM